MKECFDGVLKPLAALMLVIAAACTSSGAGGGGDIETKANTIMREVFGPCFAPIYDGNLAEASVVRTSTETEGVVTVSVFLTDIATGTELIYNFRVNTGLGDYSGLPEPGTGIPVNDTAAALVESC